MSSDPGQETLKRARRRAGGLNTASRGETGSRPRLAGRETDPQGDIEAMRRSLKSIPTVRLALFGGVAGLILLTRAVAGDSESIGVPLEPAALQAQATVVTPRYVYGSGAQGFGYYTAPAPQPAAAAPRPAAPARSSVGPGVRNWSTGRRSPLHRPWMRPM